MNDAMPDLLDELEAQARRVETPCGEGSMVWRVWGAGFPLVLLHGMHGAWSHWVRNIPALRQNYQIWAADMPCFGDSATAPFPHTAPKLAGILADGIRQALGEARLHVVGFSVGAMIAAHLAAALGGQVGKLGLVGGGGTGLPSARREPFVPWRRAGSPEAVLAAHRRNLEILMLHDPASVDALALRLQAQNVPRSRCNENDTVRGPNIRAALPHVSARIVSIWGEFDQVAGGRLAEREAILRGYQPDLDFRIIAGAGHWVMYEAAAAFNPLLLEMLAAA